MSSFFRPDYFFRLSPLLRPTAFTPSISPLTPSSLPPNISFQSSFPLMLPPPLPAFHAALILFFAGAVTPFSFSFATFFFRHAFRCRFSPRRPFSSCRRAYAVCRHCRQRRLRCSFHCH